MLSVCTLTSARRLSAEWLEFLFTSDHICLCVFVCAVTVMMNQKCKHTAPTAGFPLSAALGWLVCVCVCVCVQGTAVLQRYMGRSGGDTNGLQLWPRGLWELWLEQRGRGEKRRTREQQKRFNGGGQTTLQAEARGRHDKSTV